MDAEPLSDDAAPIAAADITEAVIRRFDACPDPRLREIMQALVAHLHGFISRGRADARRSGPRRSGS